MVVRNLDECVRRLRIIGLHVVATACDGGSNNHSAIKGLKDAYQIESCRNGEENRSIGFKLGDDLFYHSNVSRFEL